MLIGYLWPSTVAVFAQPPELEPEIRWVVRDRKIALGSWRARVETAANGVAWIGGSRDDEPSRHLLYRLQGGGWQLQEDFPVETGRAFVLDLDASDGLWVAPYRAEAEEVYRSLTIWRYSAGQWREHFVEPGIWPQAIDMITADEGWLVGNNGQLLHFRDGAWHHRTLDLPADQLDGLNLLDVEMVTPSEGWAVGRRGLVAHYRAKRWRVIEPPAALRDDLWSLDVDSNGVLWVVSLGGFVGRFDGRSWHLERPTEEALFAIKMMASDDGWAVGEAGTILRFEGDRWRHWPSPTRSALFDISMLEPTSGWIVGLGVLLEAVSAPRSKNISLLASTDSARYPMLRQPGRRAAAVDLDRDGTLDLVTASAAGVHIFRNLGGARFSPAETLPLSLPGQAGDHWLSLSPGDVDSDGWLDLLVIGGRPGSVRLLRSNRGSTFEEIARHVGLETLDIGRTFSAQWIDLDRDGALDLHLAHSELPGTTRAPDFLWRNNGGGRLVLRPISIGGEGGEKLALWGDLDGDLDADAVMPGYDGQESRLLLTQADGSIRSLAKGNGLEQLAPGLYYQGHLTDLDLDGDLDLLLLGARLQVFRNRGDARFVLDDELFEPLRSSSGVHSWTSSLGDLDLDGYPEVLLQPVTDGQRSLRLYSRDFDGRYRDVTAASGLSGIEGESAVMADWDADGDLDLFVAARDRGYFLTNQRDAPDYLKIRPRGIVSNRLAVGARVRIYRRDAGSEEGSLVGHQQVALGHNPTSIGHLHELHFGLGPPAEEAQPDARYDVEVVFPSGRVVWRRGIPAGRTVKIFELPPGLRHGHLALAAAERSLRRADPLRELTKGLLVLTVLLAGYRVLRARLGEVSNRFRLVLCMILSIYLGAAALLAGQSSLVSHLSQVVAVGLTVALAALAEISFCRWRKNTWLGPYRLGELLGQGGMGRVYRAQDRRRGAVALKIIHPHLLSDERRRERFLREAEILTRLDHPNIVRVLDRGEVDDRAYLALELLHGESLGQRLERQGTLESQALWPIFDAICDALAYIHDRGILHRDIKSDNIFLIRPTEDDTSSSTPFTNTNDGRWRRRIRLMDFGLAHSLDMPTFTRSFEMLGTVGYMAPEQLRGAPGSIRSDLFALGVVLLEAVLGRPAIVEAQSEIWSQLPGRRKAPHEHLRRQLPGPLGEVITRLLDHQPERRYASAREVCKALRQALPEPGFAPEGKAASRLGEDSWPGTSSWQDLFSSVRQCLEEQRLTEAQVLMMRCLELLRSDLQPLTDVDKQRYLARDDVVSLCALADRLYRSGKGDGPFSETIAIVHNPDE